MKSPIKQISEVKPSRALDYTEEFRASQGELLELTNEQKSRLLKFLISELEDWESDTSQLHQTLQDWNDVLEGEVEDTDYPYEGAPNTHIDLVGICMKIYHTIATRSILGQREIWYGITTADSDVADSWVDKIEEMVNIKTELEWNLKDGMMEAIYCSARDGLCALKIPYVEDYQTVKEVIGLESVEDLVSEFGDDLSSTGLSEEEIADLVQRVQTEASPDNPVEIVVQYEKPVYIGPKAYLVERVNFVTFPANAKSIEKEDCRGFGDRFWLRRGEVKRMAADGQWYEDAVKKLTKKKEFDENSNYNTARNEIIGIGDKGAKDRLEFFNLTVYFDLFEDGVEEKFIVTVSKEHKKLMECRNFPYGVDHFALFRRERRPGQIDGRSIIGELEFLNDEIDHRHNSRAMSMDITNIPSFKAKKSASKTFDPMASENRWRPGVTFWLDDPEAFEQFRVQPVDYGQSLAEEEFLMKIGSLVVGFNIYAFSGSVMPEDPQAPGNKTAMLIEQGNLRMQSTLEELRTGVDKVSEIILSHLYQFGPAQLSYKTVDENGQFITQSIPKRVLRSGIILKMKATSVITNADDELKRWSFVRQMALTEPSIATNVRKRVGLLKKVFSKANLYGAEKLLPNERELQMFDVQQAMMMQAQKMQQQGGGRGLGGGGEDNQQIQQIEQKSKIADTLRKQQTNKVKAAADRVKALSEIKAAIQAKER